jgi:hypothetical protein
MLIRVASFFTFWNDSGKQGWLLNLERVKFKWVDDKIRHEDFFELHILVDELTKDVSLMVVDFAKDEVEELLNYGKIKFQI